MIHHIDIKKVTHATGSSHLWKASHANQLKPTSFFQNQKYKKNNLHNLLLIYTTEQWRERTERKKRERREREKEIRSYFTLVVDVLILFSSYVNCRTLTIVSGGFERFNLDDLNLE